MGKTCVPVSGFRDLITTNGEPVHARTVVTIVVYSIQTGVEVIAERRVTLFRNMQLSKNCKLQRHIDVLRNASKFSQWKSVAPMCETLNRNKACLHTILLNTYTHFCILISF